MTDSYHGKDPSCQDSEGPVLKDSPLMAKFLVMCALPAVSGLGGPLILGGFQGWQGYRQVNWVHPVLYMALVFLGSGVAFLFGLALFRRWINGRTLILGFVALGLSPLLAIKGCLVAEPIDLWLVGFAYRVETHFDLERARGWAKDCVSEFESGKLQTSGRLRYYSISSCEISPENIPRFITSPWRIAPVTGILKSGVYVSHPCVCLSWYGYHLILAAPSEHLNSTPAIVRMISEDCFILYDSPK